MKVTKMYLGTGEVCLVKAKNNETKYLPLIITSIFLFFGTAVLNYYWNDYVTAYKTSLTDYIKTNISLMSMRNAEKGIGAGGEVKFSVNMTPCIDPVSGESNIMLKISDKVQGDFVAEIYLDDNQQMVYQSEQMEPGTYLHKISLDGPMDVGNHHATLYVKEYQDGIVTAESDVGLTIIVPKE